MNLITINFVKTFPYITKYLNFGTIYIIIMRLLVKEFNLN